MYYNVSSLIIINNAVYNFVKYRLMALNLKKDHFSYIFIDEASQCIELESLIPFALASSQNERAEGMLHAQIIVAGDPYQLGPVVHCKKIEHLLGNYNYRLEIMSTYKHVYQFVNN